MKYPTIEEVEQAGQEQLARWSRFLPSPGISAVGTPEFIESCTREVAVNTRIQERFYGEYGGWNPELSKKIGWHE